MREVGGIAWQWGLASIGGGCADSVHFSALQPLEFTPHNLLGVRGISSTELALMNLASGL